MKWILLITLMFLLSLPTTGWCCGQDVGNNGGGDTGEVDGGGDVSPATPPAPPAPPSPSIDTGDSSGDVPEHPGSWEGAETCGVWDYFTGKCKW